MGVGGEEVLGLVDKPAVARVSREFPNRSNLGGLFIDPDGHGKRGDNNWNRTFAVDGKLGLWGKRWTFNSFAAPHPNARITRKRTTLMTHFRW